MGEHPSSASNTDSKEETSRDCTVLKSPTTPSCLRRAFLLNHSAASPLPAPLKRQPRAQRRLPFKDDPSPPLKRPRHCGKAEVDGTSTARDTSEDARPHQQPTRRERYLQRLAALNREKARRVLVALAEEKRRRHEFHEPKGRFHADILMDIMRDVSEQLLQESEQRLADRRAATGQSTEK